MNESQRRKKWCENRAGRGPLEGLKGRPLNVGLGFLLQIGYQNLAKIKGIFREKSWKPLNIGCGFLLLEESWKRTSRRVKGQTFKYWPWISAPNRVLESCQNQRYLQKKELETFKHWLWISAPRRELEEDLQKG